MQKLCIAILGLLLSHAVYCQSKLTTEDWQSDLRFLQQTVHKDYSFLFKNVTATHWNKEVEKLYTAMPGIQEHERMAGLARLVAMFKYGHTDIGWRESPIKYQVIPLSFYWFSDGVYVEGADKKYPELIGARLLKVEGMPVAEVLAALKPLVPAENDQYYKAYGLDFLVVPQALHAQRITTSLKNVITYSFERNGRVFEKQVPAMDAFRFPRKYGYVNNTAGWISSRDQSTTPLYLKNLDRICYFEYLPQQKTVYVRQSQVQDDEQESLTQFYKKVFDFVDKNDVEKLVLDFRLNGGGNNYKNKPVVTGIIENKKINKPGKLFVILGRRTFSACQNLVNELHNYTNALFVGEPTAENINFYGDNRRIELPHTKVPVYLSFAWWQDKPQWENAPWLAPQLAVEMSFEQYKNNQDPVLQSCLDFSDKDPVLDPMARLRTLFEAGELVKLEEEARKMVSNPGYKYVNFEEKINRSGYDLLNSKRIEPALFVFQLNTKLFPESPNAWDSLAEAYWNANQKDKAIEYYNKVITMDPKGLAGDNAKAMLEKIAASK